LQSQQRNRILLPPLSLLTGDFEIPSFFLSEKTFAVNLWIGSSDQVKGAKSGTHHDEGNNLYIIIKGRKKVKLFSPFDSFNLYSIGKIQDISPRGHHTYCGGQNSHWSRVSVSAPEEETRRNFPRFFNASSLSCEVEAGEMLFIPGGWWHEVTSYGTHIAMNVWTYKQYE